MFSLYMADPSGLQLPLLTRLSTFSLEKVRLHDETESVVPVPASIRALAFLSQLAVYKDLIPGKSIPHEERCQLTDLNRLPDQRTDRPRRGGESAR